MIDLEDVDASKATARLVFRNKESDEQAVGINLATGVLFALPAEKSVAPEPDMPDLDIPGSPEVLKSPGGKYVLEYTTDPDRVTLKTAKGRRLAVITPKDAPGMSDVEWSPTDDYFTYHTMSLDDVLDSSLFVFSIKSLKPTMLAKASGEHVWSDDGHMLAVVESDVQAEKSLPSRLARGRGTISVFDAGHDMTRIAIPGKLAALPQFSPSGKRLAYTQLVKDEYDDMEMFSLRVAEVPGPRVREIGVYRRKPVYMWAGNDSLAVTTYDRFAIPTLSLMMVASSARTRLVTSAEYARMEPLAYLPGPKRVVYKACKGVSEGPEELWAVEPGRPPVKLFPKGGRQ